MKKSLIYLALASLTACMGESNHDGDGGLYYFFDAPAKMWEESFPLGNGRIGMMPDGGLDNERIVLNESSMWSGSRQNTDNPEALQALPRIRELLFAGKNYEAQQLMYKSFVCGGVGSRNGWDVPYGSYQLLGNLNIKYLYETEDVTSDYYRSLRLSDAMSNMSFKRGEIYHNRQYFTSFADDVGVIKISTGQLPSQNKVLAGMVISLNRPECAKISIEGNDLKMSGQLKDGVDGDKGVRFGAKIRVVLPQGGEINRQGDTELVIKNCPEAILLVAMATDYFGKEVDTQLNNTLNAAAAKDFMTLYKRHNAAYKSLYDRVKVDFGKTQGKDTLPINERLHAFQKDKNDPELAALYYQFGRYLLISGTRPGLLPPNLQGLWANTVKTPWNGDYHANINVQMNHWIAEQGNLSELHLPLIEWVKKQVPSGQHTARTFYDARGWVMHILGNVWEFTAPGEHPSWGATNTSAAWLCEHLYTHWQYTQDKQYLADVYPVMREAALFFVDMLVEDPRNHYLVTAPTTSPENAYILPDGKKASVCAGSTMDNQIVRELFTNTIEAAGILGIDKAFCDTLAQKRSRLMPTSISPDGRIMEWLENYEEAEPRHRHVSHLYGLHPANEISLERTPELAAAARKTLEVRGDASTGWSMAWKINFWARLHDGEHAFKLLTDLLKPCVEKGTNYSRGGGTYPNLFDGHPPFQIDGNYGGAAGIGEMLLQCQNGYIEFLPALPIAWKTGSLSGICVIGGGEASARWEEGSLKSISLKALNDGDFKIKIPAELVSGKVYINNKSTKLSTDNNILTVSLKSNDVLKLQ
jgi:alpha-L-fucosidase 2